MRVKSCVVVDGLGEDYSAEFDSTLTTAAVATFEAIMVLV
jgi:hypothetical protein